MAGLSVIGAILAIIGTAVIVSLVIHVAIRIYSDFEAFVASKIAEDALGHRADGDVPALPEDLKVSHSSANNREGQRNHG